MSPSFTYMWEYSTLGFIRNQLRQAQNVKILPPRETSPPSKVCMTITSFGDILSPILSLLYPKTSLLESSQLEAVSSLTSPKGMEGRQVSPLSLSAPSRLFLLQSPCFVEGQTSDFTTPDFALPCCRVQASLMHRWLQHSARCPSLSHRSCHSWQPEPSHR